MEEDLDTLLVDEGVLLLDSDAEMVPEVDEERLDEGEPLGDALTAPVGDGLSVSVVDLDVVDVALIVLVVDALRDMAGEADGEREWDTDAVELGEVEGDGVMDGDGELASAVPVTRFVNVTVTLLLERVIMMEREGKGERDGEEDVEGEAVSVHVERSPPMEGEPRDDSVGLADADTLALVVDECEGAGEREALRLAVDVADVHRESDGEVVGVTERVVEALLAAERERTGERDWAGEDESERVGAEERDSVREPPEEREGERLVVGVRDGKREAEVDKHREGEGEDDSERDAEPPLGDGDDPALSVNDTERTAASERDAGSEKDAVEDGTTERDAAEALGELLRRWLGLTLLLPLSERVEGGEDDTRGERDPFSDAEGQGDAAALREPLREPLALNVDDGDTDAGSLGVTVRDTTVEPVGGLVAVVVLVVVELGLTERDARELGVSEREP